MRSLLFVLLLAGTPALAQDAPASSAPVRMVALNGIEIAYRDIGAGEPLVLLHGFGGCAADWEPFVEALSENYRLIVPDLRGHGHSTNPAGTFTHRQSAADVLALLNSLGVERARAMGISTGGMTLLHAAKAAPERFERLIIVGVGTAFPDETRAWVRATTLDAMPPEVADGFRACASRGELQAAGLAAQFARFADADEPDPLAPADLSGIPTPTLLVQGDRDEFFPVEQTVGFYRSLPDALLWVIPGGYHVPVYDPAVPFAATALRFLGDEARE